MSEQPKTQKSTYRRRNRRRGPRRSLWTSRLTRNIFLSNLIGLIILVSGALTMKRFEAGLINAKIDNVQSLASTITTVIGEQATGFGGTAELDVEGSRQILRGINVQDGWRVRLHNKSEQIIADTETLDDTIFMETLAPIIEERPDRPRQDIWRENIRNWIDDKLHNLPWRRARRDSLRRNLKTEVRAGLEGESSYGPRYDKDDNLIVTVSLPVKRVQEVLGVVTVESNDVASIVNAERQALAPIIALAFLAMFLTSLGLTLFISLPMRRLARAAEIVTRSAKKRDAIPDLSRRRDEIGDLSLVLRTMTEGLYNRIDDIADFAADVAHEIKNPLTSLRSASDTLRVAKTDLQREKLIDIIQQDVSRMDRLITDISKASKVDANLARETAKTLDVAEIAENIVEFYQQTRSKDGPSVVNGSNIDSNAPIYIRAYETPFAQVLRNLIDNALTFSPKTGVVTLTAKKQGKRVVFVVEDEGPGIPADNLETVFDRFYTQRPKGASFGNHSGLGLAICRQIITAHRGTIHAENRLDEAGNISGARFVVDVPRQLNSEER
jgi:two-component system sensor histidine kinase ChvG